MGRAAVSNRARALWCESLSAFRYVMNECRGGMANARRSTVVAFLLIVGLAALGACGEDEDDPGSDGEAQVAGRPLFGGSLERGRRYRTRAFDPALSLVLQDAYWSPTETESRTLLILDGSELGLERNERPRPMWLAFQRYSRVCDPDRLALESHATATACQSARLTAWRSRPPLGLARGGRFVSSSWTATARHW